LVTTSGWIAVERSKDITFNLEEYSLNIKTDSTLGSDDRVRVLFYYTSKADFAGGLDLRFFSTPVYKIQYCSSDYTNFPTNLPSDNDKVWRVTLTRTSGIRLVVHCNEVEMINILMSDSTCDVGFSVWSTYWRVEVAKIRFNSYDTASDYYQPQPLGNCVQLRCKI